MYDYTVTHVRGAIYSKTILVEQEQRQVGEPRDRHMVTLFLHSSLLDKQSIQDYDHPNTLYIYQKLGKFAHVAYAIRRELSQIQPDFLHTKKGLGDGS